MSFPRGVIIFVNKDLTQNTLKYFIKQLKINKVYDDNFDGYDGYLNFDGYITSFPDYLNSIRRDNLRVLVMREYNFHTAPIPDSSYANVVVFIKSGMVAVLKNKIGAPAQTFLLLNLTWSQLGVFD